jgi:5'-3' exonuclease
VEGGDGSEEEVPDALSPQVPIILDLLDAAGLATAEATGYEADDVIGALAHAEKADPVEVVTGDRDLFQLVRHTPTPVTVMYVGRGWNKVEVIGPAELAAKYALPAEFAGDAYADMAVLRGDPSDGLPGVAGIGEKTAAKLITDFGSLDALIAAVYDGRDRRLTARIRTKLSEAADYLTAAPTVVRVAVDAPVVLDRPDVVPAGAADVDRLMALKKRWNLGTSIDRLIAALRR